MRALLVGDIHLADKPPSIRTDEYADQILEKLTQTVDIAKQREVDCVVWVGDVFHVKAPARTSHALVQKTVDVVRAYEKPVFIVPGNHDMQYDRLDSLHKQPLGVLYKAGALPLVGPATAYGQNFDMFGIPWLYDWKKDLPKVMRRWTESGTNLIVGHAPLLPPGKMAPFEYIDVQDFVNMMGRDGSVFYGHMHDNHGVYHVENPHHVRFCNFGAISRGSLHESSLSRKPAVAIYEPGVDGKTHIFDRVELNHLPAEAVFRLSEKQIKDDKVRRLDEFLEGIEATSFDVLSVELVLAHLDTLDLKPETKNQITECLEEVMSA